MPEPITVDVQATTTQNITEQPKQVDNNVSNKDINPPIKTPDLITRVSQFKKTDTKDNQVQHNIDEQQFDFKELENIKTPEEAKAYAEKAYKSMQSGWNKKFQEVAELRKTLELQQKANSSWTPERVQSLINDPEFIKAAQPLVQSQNTSANVSTDSQWVEDNPELVNIKQELNEVKNILRNKDYQTIKVQEDMQLKDKYADYDPVIVDNTIEDMVKGRVKANREYLFKAIKYDEHVNRAYELGKQDALTEKQDKLQSVSFDTTNNIKATNDIKKEPGETDQSFFKRLYFNNFNKLKGTELRK